jgi:hypothetical protein
VDKSQRAELRAIANPLLLGEMHEDAFTLGHHWRQHFHQKAADDGGPLTVAKLRAWLDEPRPMGLPQDVQNLVILLFAEQTSRSFFLHGGAIPVELKSIPNEAELRDQSLPSEEHWREGGARAGKIFGVPAGPIRNASHVAALSSQVRARASAEWASCNRIAALLSERLSRLGADPSAPRMQTTQALGALLDALESTGSEGAVEILARASLATTADAMGAQLSKSAAIRSALENADRWEAFDGLTRVTDNRAQAAAELLARVRGALEQDELAVALAPVLEQASREAIRLLAPPPPKPGERVIEEARRDGLKAVDAEQILGEVRKKLSASPRRRLSLHWRITEEDPGS